ncbi:YidH family protein [Halobacillus sp. B23F22_1]|uniref:YidH family protein n=1 Tax=Halobacillus sp. B23F22_1 TaxID=3459514 RepID=UPI00373EFDAB
MKDTNNQIKYAQQHLANERTYLAWVRTVIAIVGIGFLNTSLHFTIGVERNLTVDIISIALGVFACILGFVIIIMSTFAYFQRKKKIMNEETFLPSKAQVTLVSTLMIIIITFIVLYFLYLET